MLFNPIYSTLIYSVVLKGVDFYLNEIILNFEMLTLINVTLNYFVKWFSFKYQSWLILLFITTITNILKLYLCRIKEGM